MSRRVLLVDDDNAMCDMLETYLTKRSYEVEACTSVQKALDKLEEMDFDVVVSDINMPQSNGIEFCQKVEQNRPNTPVILITAFGCLETAISAMRAGAYDFINKPFDVDILFLSIERALRDSTLREEITRLRQKKADTVRPEKMIGDGPAMKEVYALINQISKSNASVLITGESGTGKELCAKALHEQSSRNHAPFVAMNCAAMPETLLESELFGYEKGAFTDAKTRKPGLFIQANGGTLFLDEIGDMPIGLQPKLLRALEERTVRPIGGKGEVSFDIRLISATNRELELAIEDGKFREDLYYRINVVQIQMPPLRIRGTDILNLAQHFLDIFAEREGKRIHTISAGAAKKLLSYSWPGNVRELKNCIERSIALAQFDTIVPEDLPDKIKNYKASNLLVTSTNPDELVSMEEVERIYISRVHAATGGRRAQAAQILGFDRKTLYRKMLKYSLESHSKKTLI